ncbi:hypothetical protein ACNR9W_016855 (plasmid) [Paracoccus sp. T5]|uniref:hypothetical protein n=1 Tax=Paracoccus sp. T5 TaxID=3402161 RepID=UPI003AE64F6A
MTREKADAGAMVVLRPRSRSVIAGLQSRMKGPGGYYNLGNIIAFSVAALQAIVAGGAASGAGGSMLMSLKEYLVGSPSASAITLAMLIFFMSGEAYYRAWREPTHPSPNLLRLGDALSAVAALALSASLVLIGNTALGLASSALLVGGKLGSASRPDASWFLGLKGMPKFDPFRAAVVLSRLPALLAIAAALAAAEAAPAILVQQLTLLVCYALWLRADLMLFRAR